LWAVLAIMAINAKSLSTAELAFSAIDEVDKLQYIKHIVKLPSPASMNAELALFKRDPLEAERILIGEALYYRAIKLNVKLFRWERYFYFQDHFLHFTSLIIVELWRLPSNIQPMLIW